jgi:hypothetical protein
VEWWFENICLIHCCVYPLLSTQIFTNGLLKAVTLLRIHLYPRVDGVFNDGRKALQAPAGKFAQFWVSGMMLNPVVDTLPDQK